MQPVISGTGGATRLGPPNPIGIITLGLSRLPARSAASFRFRTAIHGSASVYFTYHNDIEPESDDAVKWFVGGSWRIQARTATWTVRRCIYPITYDRAARHLSAEGPNRIGITFREIYVMV
jgi:hypothetical protein